MSMAALINIIMSIYGRGVRVSDNSFHQHISLYLLNGKRVSDNNFEQHISVFL